MKFFTRLLSIIVFFALCGQTFGQTAPLFSENFTGSAGTVLTSAGWTISGTSVVNPITIAAPGLTFNGYAGSGVGNAAPLANNGQDVFATFPAVNSGSVYLSFMMNASAVLTGDYFIALSASASQTNYMARLHVKSSGAGYVVGISKNNEVSGGAQYGTTVLPLNSTNLVVVKYTFVPSDSLNDAISVYVFPTSVPKTEPATAEIAGYTNSTKNDAANLGIITLRQGSSTAAPTMVIDGIRVGTSWDFGTTTAVENLPAGIPSEYELSNNYPNPFNPNTTIRYALPFESNVKITVYNLIGEVVSEVVNDVQQAGYYESVFNASSLASGIYLYSITAHSTNGSKDFSSVRKMILMK